MITPAKANKFREAVSSPGRHPGLQVITPANARKAEAEEKAINNYFCVKMTVIIEVEGVSSKKKKLSSGL